MFLLIALLILVSVSLVVISLTPQLHNALTNWQEKKEKTLTKQLDELYYDKSPKEVMRLYFILPPGLGLVAYFMLHSFLFAVMGGLFGLLIPNLILKMRDQRRRQKFSYQILDAIMILSGALKAGLSLLQALEVLVEEMPAPMSQEIGLLVRENKMGITLEDSFNHLNKRMNMEELSLVINSILVARETGGDLTKVFSRLTTTIRDNRKLKDNIRTLTLQGRMQGIIMSLLPFLFVWWVLTFNRNHFEVMLNNELGRMLLFAAVFLQIIGMILIRKFSTIKI